MANTLYTGANLESDVGHLKGDPRAWDNLQNIRGWGNFIAKRQGIQNSVSSSYGTMGIFDLRNDGDPLSPDKILVVNTNGDFVLYDFSEFVVVFDFMFNTGINLNLQAPNNTWFSVRPDEDGEITTTFIAAPVTTISSDLLILQDEYFGFQMTSNTYRLNVNGTTGELQVSSYGPSTATTAYSSNQSFVKTVGPVFQDEFLQRWRLSVSNIGELTLTAIA